ncbi:MAG: ATP-binding protein [Cetobacterium sp.]
MRSGDSKPEQNIIETCPHCGKPKIVMVENEIIGYDHSSCFKIAKFKKLSIFDKSSNINIFQNSVVKSQEETAHKASFEKYCRNFTKAKELGLGILMTGSPGTGKTFYSNCITNSLNDLGHSVLSFNIPGYLAEIRQGFDTKEYELRKAIEAVDFLVIDDLGSELLSEWNKEKLFNLFDLIYRNKKSVCITTNMSGEELSRHLTWNGSNKIFDRILELCKPFKFTGPSRRSGKNKMNFDAVF